MFNYILLLFKCYSLLYSFNFLRFVSVRTLHSSLGAYEIYLKRTAFFISHSPVENTQCQSIPSKHLLEMGQIAISLIFSPSV